MAVNYDPALINKVFEVTEPVEVKADKIQRFCAALGETGSSPCGRKKNSTASISTMPASAARP